LWVGGFGFSIVTAHGEVRVFDPNPGPASGLQEKDVNEQVEKSLGIVLSFM
jgi:hypothetical protein